MDIMDNKTHKFISVSYELYSVENGEEQFVEKTEDARPMDFYTGCEMALPAFENAVVNLNTGADFAFTLSQEEAYGPHNAEQVLLLNKEIFSRDGAFDAENVFVDAVLPLQNEHGQRFIARVLEITDDSVKVDLNHPLAGKDLKFTGRINESREATEEEIKEFFDKMNSHHCGGGCGGHGDGSCGCGGHGDGECGGHGDGECGCGGEGHEGGCGCH